MDTTAIDNLRIRKTQQSFRPTLLQVRNLVNSLQQCKSLSDVSKELQISENEVLNITALLGTWLTHVYGGSGAEFESATQAMQLSLLQPFVDSKDDTVKKNKKAAKIIVPEGFDSAKQSVNKRDLSRAVVSIVVAAPSDEIITRFISRTYQIQAKVLTLAHIADVWYFAKLGRLGTIDQKQLSLLKEALIAPNLKLKTLREELKNKGLTGAQVKEDAGYKEVKLLRDNITMQIDAVAHYTLDTVSPENSVLAELYVEAFDLLDIARKDALEGLKVLVSSDKDLDTLSVALQKVKWLSEGEFRTIERSLENAKNSTKAVKFLERELSFLSQRIQRNPAFYDLADISALNVGHVMRIAQAAGVKVENDAEARSVENQIRNKLKQAGLAADLDQLVAAGIKASGSGKEDLFWEVIEERLEGNSEWFLLLETLLKNL